MPNLRAALAFALPFCCAPCSIAIGQQALVVQECFAELTVQGSAPMRQSIPASSTFGPNSGFQLRANNPGGVSFSSILLDLNVQPNHVSLNTRGSATFPPLPVNGNTGGELLVTLPPGRGLLRILGDAQVTGGPGTGVATITVDVGDDTSIEMTAFPHTYTWYGEVDVFLDSLTPVPVRITVNGSLSSFLLDNFSTSIDMRFLPDTCPDAEYGPTCFPMTSQQGPGYIEYSIDTPVAFLVFGFQPLNLPIAGTTCRQLLSLDVVAGVFSGTWHQNLTPLPPGFQLLAQAARFNGAQITTSNGISLICP